MIDDKSFFHQGTMTICGSLDENRMIRDCEKYLQLFMPVEGIMLSNIYRRKASDDGTAKVVYTSKNRKFRKTFNALDWLAKLVTHIPGRYEQTVHYYGYYSNKSRGMRTFLLLLQMRCHPKNPGKTGPG